MKAMWEAGVELSTLQKPITLMSAFLKMFHSLTRAGGCYLPQRKRKTKRKGKAVSILPLLSAGQSILSKGNSSVGLL